MVCWASKLAEKNSERVKRRVIRINRDFHQSYFDAPADTVKQDGGKVNKG